MEAIPKAVQIGIAVLCVSIAASVYFTRVPPSTPAPNDVLPSASTISPVLDPQGEVHQSGEMESRTVDELGDDLLERAKLRAGQDLAGGFAILEEERDSDRRARMRILLAKDVIRKDSAALDAVLALLTRRERGSNVRLLAGEAVKTDAMGAIATIEANLSGDEKIKALSGAIDQLAKQGNFTLAISKQREISSRGVGSASFGSIARELSKGNVPGLVDWIQTLSKDEANRAISSARDTLVERQDETALQMLLPLTADEHIRRNLIVALIDLQVKRGATDDAQAFLKSLEPAEREAGTGAILVASKDIPLDAAIPQVAQFENQIALSTTIHALIQRECANDIASVAAYALRAPEPAQDAVVNALVQIWDREDSAQLEQWISRLQNDRIHDKALKHLAKSLRYSGPDAQSRALELAERIRDPDLRSESLRQFSR